MTPDPVSSHPGRCNAARVAIFRPMILYQRNIVFARNRFSRPVIVAQKPGDPGRGGSWPALKKSHRSRCSSCKRNVSNPLFWPLGLAVERKADAPSDWNCIFCRDVESALDIILYGDGRLLAGSSSPQAIRALPIDSPAQQRRTTRNPEMKLSEMACRIAATVSVSRPRGGWRPTSSISLDRRS